MKALKIEEMLVNSILTGKRYRHDTWKTWEYIYWYDGLDSKCFKDEAGYSIDTSDYSTMIDGWTEYKEEE
jgi:hypothetical protein